MAKIRIPYLKWRNGRPRWEPSPELRRDGWKGRDLKAADGSWLDRYGAAREAEALNAELAKWRQTRRVAPGATTTEGGGTSADKPPVATRRTVAALFEVYFASARFKKRAARTQRDYRNKANAFLDEFGEAPLASVGRGHLHAFWEEAHDNRGHAMANGIMAVVRAAFSHATRLEWIGVNPALKMELPGTAPRRVLWLPPEIAHIIATADHIGLPSVADAAIIALHSGQRQGDVLGLPDRLFVGDRIALTQSKRGALIDAPMTPQLAARVDDIRARKRTMPIASLDALVVYEGSGQPYSGDLFGKKWRIVRGEAARTMPEIAGKTFQDLRDTSITRLALAGCNIHQLCAITGHEEKTAHQILRHYVVTTPEMADAAIAKLVAYMEREQITM